MFQNDVSYELKHRITGAVVLVGITLIILGWVLDKPKETQGGEQNYVAPAAPELLPISTDPAVPSQDFVSKIVNEDNPGSAISESSSTGVGFVKAKQLPALNITPHLSPVTQIAKPSAVLNVVEVKQTKTLSRESSESKVSEYKSSQWIVRVGAFDKKSNANKLVDDLKKLDFPAKKRAIKIQDRTVVRVWVGPYDNRKQAQRIKAQINKSLKQNAFVARAGQ